MSTRSIGTRGLTEGAILAALVALFAVATRYLPVIGMATALLCPLPLAVLVIRHGLRVAAIAGVVSALVGATLAGPLVGLGILISFAPMGLVLGIGARQGWDASRVVLLGALVTSISMTVSFLGLLGAGPRGAAAMAEEMQKTMERSAEMSASLYARMGLPKAQIEAATAQMREVARQLPYLLPVALVFSVVIAAWLNYEVGRRVLHRFGYRLKPLPPLRTWRLPAAAVWLVPLSFLVLVVGTAPGGVAALQGVGRSLMIGTQILFMLQGLLAGLVILGNFGFGRFAQAMAVAFAMVTPIVGTLLVILGILDSALKVRERWGMPRPKPSGAKL
ncbi:MAG: YybS family protein [Armatimonadetes bacterium]|nr:YybS family protein [Armatimonadota bacterium]